MPFGAELDPDGGTRFRLWAPTARRVELEVAGDLRRLEIDAGGWAEHRTESGAAPAGSAYRYRIDGERRVPDPASRAQRSSVHGASLVVDPEAYRWSVPWSGIAWEEAVLYELHVGTFTPEGTFAAAAGRLDELRALGITAVELMPVADFPGERGWGYDGVLPYAPYRGYGTPDDLKSLVEACHALGLAIFLDVVYNHFGPEGNYLGAYAADFYDPDRHTPWGAGLRFDHPDPARARTVRDFFIENACYWLVEYDFDGLRLDAVHAIRDRSPRHVLRELAERAGALPGRRRHLVLENGDNAASFLERRRDGAPRWYVAQWNDDIHHALHVAVTGERGGYYAAYPDPVGALARCLAEGFAYQGEPFPGWTDAGGTDAGSADARPTGAGVSGARPTSGRGPPARGEPSADLPPTAFVSFLQNHDQVGNRAFGERLHALAPDEAVRAVTAILLLAPEVPLLFMGQEWGTRRPFLYFSDLGAELGPKVSEGRRREFAAFGAFADVPDPQAPSTAETSRIDWAERDEPEHAAWLQTTHVLLAIRAREITPRLRSGGSVRPFIERLGERGLRVAWRLADGVVLWLAANLSGEPASDELAELPGRAIHASGGAAGEWYVAFSVEG